MKPNFQKFFHGAIIGTVGGAFGGAITYLIMLLLERLK